MSHSPTFSVVIPAYNRIDLLQCTLLSVENQEFRDFEVIVVDDGSTDDFSVLEKEFQGQVRFLRQSNAGPSAARNLGASVAQGEYLAFLDNDDLWFPWTLSVYQKVIADHGSPAFIAGCPVLFSSPQELTGLKPAALQTRSFSDYLQSGDAWRWFGVSSFVIRRDYLIQCQGFSNNLRYSEDADLAMKLGVAPGFVQIVSPITFGYRQGSGEQLTVQWKPQVPAVQSLIANELNDRYPGAEARAIERRRIISRHARPIALLLLQQREFSTAWKLYLTLFSWNLRLGQWKFVFGFPASAIWRQAFGRMTASRAR